MSDKCLYCNTVLSHEGFSVCDSCGKKVWGEKMYKTIRENMNIESTNQEIESA